MGKWEAELATRAAQQAADNLAKGKCFNALVNLSLANRALGGARAHLDSVRHDERGGFVHEVNGAGQAVRASEGEFEERCLRKRKRKGMS